MALRAHLRSKFRKHSAPEETVSKLLHKHSSDGPASSGSDVNSSADEQSSVGDFVMDGGSSPTPSKKNYKDGASGDSTSPVNKRKERGTGRLSIESSRPRSESGTSRVSQWDESERNIYETQLKSLQEQLVDIMIENQSLNVEVAKYKANNSMTQLLQQLDQEKDKCANLSQECEELQGQLENVERRSYSIVKEQHSTGETDSVDMPPSDASTGPPSPNPTWKSKVQEWVVHKVYEVISDFTEEADDDKTNDDDEGEELAVKKLKANIKRFKTGYQPIIQWGKAVGNLFGWKSAPASFIAFIIYVYAVSKGWLVSLILALALWHLTKTYFTSKGFAVKFSLLPYAEEEENSDMDKQLGLSDKFQLVLLVARRVQNYMGSLADGLEKLQNLVMWGNPAATQQLYTGLLCAFIGSIILPGEWFFIAAGIFLGIKLFITDNVFGRFPRVRAKYDSSYVMWQSLPTHAEKERRKTLERRKKYVISGVVTDTAPDQSQENFLQMFSLPAEELPLPGWQAGKRCIQVAREKTVSLKNGRIYLTRSFLCFERTRLKNRLEKHIVIPLSDIVTVQKVKPFAFFPGSGMSIEIRVFAEDKPYVFGAIINRDEVHAVILRQVCSVRDSKMRENSAMKTKRTEASSSLTKDHSLPSTSTAND